VKSLDTERDIEVVLEVKMEKIELYAEKGDFNSIIRTVEKQIRQYYCISSDHKLTSLKDSLFYFERC
jgi:hypothetical protein